MSTTTEKEEKLTTGYPIDDCPKCKLQYWACACGASPLSWKKDEPPTVCKNIHCLHQEFTFVTSYICCQRHNHHLGTRCPHCGTMG